MNKVKNLLSEIAVSVTSQGNIAEIYFSGQKIEIQKAFLDHDMAGLLICEVVNGATISIDIEEIDAVLEHCISSMDS